jgi:hypothetical protein
MVVALGWWAVGPWYEYGGGPTALECSPRINNQCRQWFLCRKQRSTIRFGMGRNSWLYLFPLAYQRMCRSGAVVYLRGASGWVESPQWFPGSGGLWWIAATTGVEAKAGVTTVRNQTGGGISLSKSQVCRGRQLPKRRPARVANRSWSRKRMGMQGRGKEQWLARIIGWAPHMRSVDGNSYSDVQQALISYGYKWPPLQSVRKYLDTPCSGKELRTWQERSPSKL